MIKTNIKMRVTPEQSRRVQEICFENGIYWAGENKDKVSVYSNFLYIRGLITHDSLNNFTCFKNAEEKEIDADLFIKTNGTCEETYLTKYTSQPKDLESALKKIENLHIALNKKVEKNKNQALEITILLEQKKSYKENIEVVLKSQNDMIDILTRKVLDLECENNELQSNLGYKNECTKQLISDKEKFKNKILSLEQQVTNQSINMKEILKQLEEKDTIISYLESKLK